MPVINKILAFLLNLLNTILPKLNLDIEFLTGLDNAITTLIDLMQKASYFIPLDSFVICLTAMFVVDNFALGIRIAQWVIRTIRG